MGPFWCSEVSCSLKLLAGSEVQPRTMLLAQRFVPPVIPPSALESPLLITAEVYNHVSFMAE